MTGAVVIACARRAIEEGEGGEGATAEGVRLVYNLHCSARAPMSALCVRRRSGDDIPQRLQTPFRLPSGPSHSARLRPVIGAVVHVTHSTSKNPIEDSFVPRRWLFGQQHRALDATRPVTNAWPVRRF